MIFVMPGLRTAPAAYHFRDPPFCFFGSRRSSRRGVAVASGSVARNNLRPRCGFTGDDMWLALLGEGMLATLLSFSELNRLGRLNRPWSDLVTNHVVHTVSTVLCLRPLRTSRWFWAVPVAVAASRNPAGMRRVQPLVGTWS